MAGYRRIPISPPVANNISLLAATDSISIPWDKYQEGMGNIYLDINPTGDPQITVGSDLNPLIQERYLDIKVKPVLSKAQFGPVSSPVLRIIQSPSVYVYKLELFNLDDRPEGNKLESATPFWTEDMGLGPINTLKSAKGGEFIDTYVYYCEYRNGIRTKAHIVCTDTWETQWDWLEVENTPQGEFIITAENRDTIVGEERRQLVRGSYNPLEDSTFDWHDGYLDPYPIASLDFYIEQEKNEETIDSVTWEILYPFPEYGPMDMLPWYAGNGATLWFGIYSKYTIQYNSGESISVTTWDSNHNQWYGDIPNLVTTSFSGRVYCNEDNTTNAPKTTTFYATVSRINANGTKTVVSISPTYKVTQLYNDGLVKAFYGDEGIINTHNNIFSSYPKE